MLKMKPDPVPLNYAAAGAARRRRIRLWIVNGIMLIGVILCIILFWAAFNIGWQN